MEGKSFNLSEGEYIILFPCHFWSKKLNYPCCVAPNKEATLLRVPVKQKCDHKVLHDLNHTNIIFHTNEAVIAK